MLQTACHPCSIKDQEHNITVQSTQEMHWFNEWSLKKEDSAAWIPLNSGAPAAVLKLLHTPREGITYVSLLLKTKQIATYRARKTGQGGMGMERHKRLMQFIFSQQIHSIRFQVN